MDFFYKYIKIYFICYLLSVEKDKKDYKILRKTLTSR